MRQAVVSTSSTLRRRARAGIPRTTSAAAQGTGKKQRIDVKKRLIPTKETWLFFFDFRTPPPHDELWLPHLSFLLALCIFHVSDKQDFSPSSFPAHYFLFTSLFPPIFTSSLFVWKQCSERKSRHNNKKLFVSRMFHLRFESEFRFTEKLRHFPVLRIFVHKK